MQAADDRILLERLRTGEDSAFGELFSRHAEAVRRLALGLVNDRAEADDLTAEAFFRVLQAIRRGNGPVDNVRGYLLIVARRVAGEWSMRRRDVPVSDEELTSRAGSDSYGVGQSAERNLITQAFTSLPERWRSVLWKVEVEGERPAVVANNFGLSPNATAALARRARQGLRAAYLQAHLTVDRGAVGCRSVLEKLGAYTAGSIKGAERRRIRLHLTGCSSCRKTHDELRDVCSGLRANAGVLLAPAGLAAVAADAATGEAAGAVVATKGAGLGATIKGALATTKVQVGVAASAAAAAGMFGLGMLTFGGGDQPSLADDFDGKRGIELTHSSSGGPSASGSGHPTTSAPSSTTSRRQTATNVADNRTGVSPKGGGVAPVPGSPTTQSPTITVTKARPTSSPEIWSRETRVYRTTEGYGDYQVVRETVEVTEINTANQTKTTTTTNETTRPVYGAATDTPTSTSSRTPEPPQR
nr:sigma-70 family RNA polymerase sigma factor [Herbihabitans rhizosphaerae]